MSKPLATKGVRELTPFLLVEVNKNWDLETKKPGRRKEKEVIYTLESSGSSDLIIFSSTNIWTMSMTLSCFLTLALFSHANLFPHANTCVEAWAMTCIAETA